MQSRRFLISTARRAAFCALLCSCAVSARAQQAGDGAALVQAAYKASQSAKTTDEFADVIQRCAAAEKAGLDEKNAAYIKQLSGWAHNRRGESLIEQAAELTGPGQADQAAELDAAALADFEEAVRRDPTHWKALHNRGVSYAVAEKLDEAVADFTSVIELRRDYVNAWFNRAEIYYELGQTQKAIADYGEVIRRDDDDAGAYISRGHAYFKLRDYQQAFEDYGRAVELAPRDADALANRGDAYASLGRWQQAAADYRRAVNIDDENARAYQSAAWLMATCPDEDYRDAALAVDAAEKAVKLAGDGDYKYLDTLAAALASAGRYDDAVEKVQAAIAAAPQSQTASLEKRLALYKANKPYRTELKPPSDAPGR